MCCLPVRTATKAHDKIKTRLSLLLGQIVEKNTINSDFVRNNMDEVHLSLLTIIASFGSTRSAKIATDYCRTWRGNSAQLKPPGWLGVLMGWISKSGMLTGNSVTMCCQKKNGFSMITSLLIRWVFEYERVNLSSTKLVSPVNFRHLRLVMLRLPGFQPLLQDHPPPPPPDSPHRKGEGNLKYQNPSSSICPSTSSPKFIWFHEWMVSVHAFDYEIFCESHFLCFQLGCLLLLLLDGCLLLSSNAWPYRARKKPINSPSSQETLVTLLCVDRNIHLY